MFRQVNWSGLYVKGDLQRDLQVHLPIQSRCYALESKLCVLYLESCVSCCRSTMMHVFWYSLHINEMWSCHQRALLCFIFEHHCFQCRHVILNPKTSFLRGNLSGQQLSNMNSGYFLYLVLLLEVIMFRLPFWFFQLCSPSTVYSTCFCVYCYWCWVFIKWQLNVYRLKYHRFISQTGTKVFTHGGNQHLMYYSYRCTCISLNVTLDGCLNESFICSRGTPIQGILLLL